MTTTLSALEIFLVVASPFIGSWLATLARAWPVLPAQAVRSRCAACGKAIPAWRMVPIISYLAQRGRCRNCGGPISPLHPIVEAACLAGAAVAVTVADGAAGIGGCVLAWLLIYASAVDARTRELPDWSSAAIAVLGVGLALASGGAAIAAHAGAALLTVGLLAGLQLAWRRITGREGLGFGDVKLAGAGALVVGPLAVAPAIAIAGALTLAAVLLRGAPQQPIAFGPGLAGGFFSAWAIHVGGF